MAPAWLAVRLLSGPSTYGEALGETSESLVVDDVNPPLGAACGAPVAGAARGARGASPSLPSGLRADVRAGSEVSVSLSSEVAEEV